MELRTEPFVLNMGPQHPSTHGVFRMRVTYDGEVVVDLEPMFGYLHRGIEKLAETRTYTQFIPLTDRLSYLTSMANNHAYVLAAEKVAGITVPERGEYLRVIMDELMRISNHLMAVGFFLNDLGCSVFTPLLYMYREREKLLDLFEMVCGQRLTYNYMRIGGVSHDLPEEFLPAVHQFVAEMPSFIDCFVNMANGMLTMKWAIEHSSPSLRQSREAARRRMSRMSPRGVTFLVKRRFSMCLRAVTASVLSTSAFGRKDDLRSNRIKVSHSRL